MTDEITPRLGEVAEGVLTNYICEARLITFPAPYNLAAGDGFLVGQLFAVATRAAVAGGAVEGMIQGVFSLPKKAGEVWTNGVPVYWNHTTRVVQLDGRTPPVDFKFIGYGLNRATATDPTGIVVIGIAGIDSFGAATPKS